MALLSVPCKFMSSDSYRVNDSGKCVNYRHVLCFHRYLSYLDILMLVMKTDKTVKVGVDAPVMAPPTRAKPRDEAKAAA